MSRWRGNLLTTGILFLLALLAMGNLQIHADGPEMALDATLNSATANDLETVSGAASSLATPLEADGVESPSAGSAASVIPAAGAPFDDVAAGQSKSVETPKPVALPAWRTLEPAYSAATPLPASGKAMYYNPGVMAEVIESRLKYDQIDPCEHCIGYVAMLRYGDLNRRVWLQLDEWRIEGPFHVVDAAASQHVGQLIARDWAVDVDHETAQRWGMRMPYVTIWETPPLALLLSDVALQLHWRATLAPAEPFIVSPQSRNVHIDEHHAAVKRDLKLRHRSMESYVDLAVDIPPELNVK